MANCLAAAGYSIWIIIPRYRLVCCSCFPSLADERIQLLTRNMTPVLLLRPPTSLPFARAIHSFYYIQYYHSVYLFLSLLLSLLPFSLLFVFIFLLCWYCCRLSPLIHLQYTFYTVHCVFFSCDCLYYVCHVHCTNNWHVISDYPFSISYLSSS